jgi:hypothetical protein
MRGCGEVGTQRGRQPSHGFLQTSSIGDSEALSPSTPRFDQPRGPMGCVQSSRAGSCEEAGQQEVPLASEHLWERVPGVNAIGAVLVGFHGAVDPPRASPTNRVPSGEQAIGHRVVMGTRRTRR